MRILNTDILTSHGNTTGRKKMIDLLETGLNAANPYNNVAKLIHLEGNHLIVGNPHFDPRGSPFLGEEEIDLDRVGRIFVIGAAKGVQYVAKAIEDILGERLTGGQVIAKHGDDHILSRISVTYGAHPVPDEGCVKGCQNIHCLCQQLQANDLVFTIVGNGVSALLTYPVEGVSLEMIRDLTYEMQITKGAPTQDLNPVRNHLDRMKGGQISRHLKKARVIHLLAFDANECNPTDFRKNRGYDDLMERNLWLHTLPDFTTFADAITMLKKWNVWKQIPNVIQDHLQKADPLQETVKRAEFEQWKQRIFGIMPNHLGVLPSVEKRALDLGIQPHILSRFLQAEASQVGLTFMDFARMIESEGKPFRPPCALISGGELLVTVGNEKGMGGRNQEFALSAARRIKGNQYITVGAIDTDGTDGPGDQFLNSGECPTLGGGLIDGFTVSEMESAGIDIHTALQQHNSSPALWKVNCGIQIQHNISLGDLDVVLIDEKND